MKLETKQDCLDTIQRLNERISMSRKRINQLIQARAKAYKRISRIRAEREGMPHYTEIPCKCKTDKGRPLYQWFYNVEAEPLNPRHNIFCRKCKKEFRAF